MTAEAQRRRANDLLHSVSLRLGGEKEPRVIAVEISEGGMRRREMGADLGIHAETRRRGGHAEKSHRAVSAYSPRLRASASKKQATVKAFEISNSVSLRLGGEKERPVIAVETSEGGMRRREMGADVKIDAEARRRGGHAENSHKVVAASKKQATVTAFEISNSVSLRLGGEITSRSFR